MTRLVSLLLPLVLGACASSVAPEEASSFTSPEVLVTELDRARLVAEIGPFRAASDDGWATLYDHGDSWALDVRARDEGVVMAGVRLWRLPLDKLRTGDRFVGGMRHQAPQDEPLLTGVGCGGETDGVWDIDRGATEVVVEVGQDEDGALTIAFDGVLDTGQSFEGQVVLPHADGVPAPTP